MIKFFHRGFLIAAMFFVGITYTGAYFSDSVSSSGNTFTAGTWAVSPAKVTISEVFYNATGVNDTGFEWIEIANTGGQAINMTGYDLYPDGAGYYYTFPAFSLNPNAIVLIHLNTDGVDSATDLYTGSGHSNMNNANGSIAIFNSTTHNSSTIIDYVRFGTGTTWQTTAVSAGIWISGSTVAPVGVGHSMELIGKVDNNLVTDWQDQAVPTPGA